MALRRSYDVTEANLLHTYRQSYQSAIDAWQDVSETELATYRKARVRADMTQGNALQLAGAEYDVAMTRASSTLGSGLRSAQRQYDKDLKKLADDIATDSRNANRAWNTALVNAGLKLAQGSINDNANRQAAQATAMGTYLSAIQTAFSTAFGGTGTGSGGSTGGTGTGGDGGTTGGTGTGGTGTNGTGTNTSGTGGNPFTAMASLATASAGWMSTVLGLSVAKDQAIGDATEDRGVAKAKAEDGLIEGVVAGVQEWLNGTISARAAFRIASIGFNAAKGVAYRSAVAAYDIADINRELEASETSRATGSARALSLAQDERDAVVNQPQSEWSSQPPTTPMIWYGMPITPEDQAASRAYQYRETMDHWGVTALRTWIAEVDDSGVLDEDEAEQSPASPGPDSNNNPASPGNGAGNNNPAGPGNEAGNNPSDPNSNPQTGAGTETGNRPGTASSPPGGPTTAPPPGDNGPNPQDAWNQALQSAQNSLNGVGNVSSPFQDSMDPDSPNYGFDPDQEFVIPIRRPGVSGEMDEIEAAFAPILNRMRGVQGETTWDFRPPSTYVSTPYANATLVERFNATFLYAVEHGLFPSEMQDQVEELAQPANLAIMGAAIAATLGVFTAAQATPGGWLADVFGIGLMAVGGGSAAVNIGDSLYTISQIETEADRRDAAKQLARQMNGAAIDALLGLIGGKGGKIADKAKEGLETAGRIKVKTVGLATFIPEVKITLAPKKNAAINNLKAAADEAIDAAGSKADDAANAFTTEASKTSQTVNETQRLAVSLRDPEWRSTQTGSTSGNSRLLRQNLGDEMQEGHHAHHIVQSTDTRAKEAQQILDDLQIDINDASNGVSLQPTGERPAHHGQGLHSSEAIGNVTRRLNAAAMRGTTWAERRQNVIDELAAIKQDILSGPFP